MLVVEKTKKNISKWPWKCALIFEGNKNVHFHCISLVSRELWVCVFPKSADIHNTVVLIRYPTSERQIQCAAFACKNAGKHQHERINDDVNWDDGNCIQSEMYLTLTLPYDAVMWLHITTLLTDTATHRLVSHSAIEKEMQLHDGNFNTPRNRDRLQIRPFCFA